MVPVAAQIVFGTLFVSLVAAPVLGTLLLVFGSAFRRPAEVAQIGPGD